MPSTFDYQKQQMIKAVNTQGRQVLEEDLPNDKNWVTASRHVYKLMKGADFQGDDKEAAKAGIDLMSKFNYNLTFGTIPQTQKLESASPVQKAAMLYLMDTYEKKDITSAGFQRAAKEIFTDPIGMMGITTPIGFAARSSAKYLAKKSVTELLSKGIQSHIKQQMVLVGTEAGVQTAGMNLAEQNVKVKAGVQKSIDKGEAATSGAIGAGLGVGIVGGLAGGAKAVGKGIDYVRKQGEEAMAQVAGGGTPPKMTVSEKAKEIEDRLRLKDFSVYERGGDVKIMMFEVPKENRKKGVGTQAMDELVKSADENGKRIVLTTGLRDDRHGTTSKNRLIQFYKRFGFVENKGRNKDFSISENMYRNPQGEIK